MKILNSPTYAALTDYHQAIEAYIDQVCTIPNVISVNTMGSINAPGLSDIDIIIVVADDFNKSDAIKLSVQGINDNLFIHGPVIIPNSMTKNLQYIIYASNIQCVWGKPCLPEFELLNENEQKVLSKCYIIDFIESRFTQFATVKLLNEVDHRAWMARLWSISHSCSLMDVIGLPLNSFELSCLETIKLTRAEWVDSGTANKELFLSAFSKGGELNKSLFIKVLKEFYSIKHPKSRDQLEVFSLDKKIIMQSSFDEIYCEAKILHVLGRSKTFYLAQYPYEYAKHIEGYGLAQTSGKTHDCLIMAKRRIIVNDHRDWVFKHVPAARSMMGYIGLQVKRPRNLKEALVYCANRILLN